MSKQTLLAVVVCATIACYSYKAIAQEEKGVSLEEIFMLADSESQQINISLTSAMASDETVKTTESLRLPDVEIALSGSYIGTATLMSRGFSRSGYTTIPYATGVGQVVNGAQPTPHWGNDLVVRVTQTIYAGGAVSAAVKSAKTAKEITKLDVEKNRQEVRFLLAGYYLELFKRQNLLKVIEDNIVLTNLVLQYMRARRKEGVVIGTDITRYELQLQGLQLQATKVSDAVCMANHQLVTTLHLPDSTMIMPLKPVILWEEHRQEADWQQQASAGNVGLKQAELAIELSKSEVKASRSKMLPGIILVAEDHLVGPYVNDLIPVDANVNSWYIGIGARYNLGSLWNKNHEVKKSKLLVKQREQQQAFVRENVQKAVQTDWLNFRTSHIEVETQKKQVELALQHYEVTRKRYENGLALLTDLLDASNTKLAAEMQLVNAEIDLIYNFYKLKYMTSSL